MLYHTLSAHSERVLRIFGRLDFSGIALLVMGSFIPWVYYQFYCRAQESFPKIPLYFDESYLVRKYIFKKCNKPRVVYLITISLLGAAAIVFSQWERFAKPEYSQGYNSTYKNTVRYFVKSFLKITILEEILSLKRVVRAAMFSSLGASGIIPGRFSINHDVL